MNNCENSLLRLLSLLKVKHTKKQVIDTLQTNPAYPSMLAMSETLSYYGVANAAIQTTNNQIDKLSLPLIAQVNVQTDSRISEASFFCAVIRVTEKEVVYYNNKNKIEKLSTSGFLKTWTGITLLAEKNEKSIEPNYANNYKANLINITLLALFTISISALIVNEFFKAAITVNLIGYFILKCIGITTAIFIIIYEIATYKPALKKFCSGGKKMDCDMVVNSKYAKILGSDLSLGTMTFAYFFATLIVLISTSFTTSNFLGNISLLTIPIVIYSIYLQAFKIKKWCKLCLVIATILTIEGSLVLMYNMYGAKVDISSLLLFLTSFLLVLLIFNLLHPIALKSQSLNLYKRGLNNMKSNPKVFETLLTASRRIETNPEGLGIVFKNNNAKHHVLKVCNPYCSPCAKAHPLLDALFENGDIDLQILFTANAHEHDFKAKPVSHFMAIYSKNGAEATQKALSHWYGAKTKDYDLFATQYPMNGELKEQHKSLEAMAAWCQSEQIMHTPTIFINGYELPKEYQLEDLKHFLK